MQIETAKRLVRAAKRMEIEGVRLYKQYSGRGMYGRTTAAVVADHFSDFMACVAGARMKRDAREGFVEEMRNLRQDSMGRGIIVY